MKFRRKATSEEISGFLDKGTTLTGELQFAGQLQIHGNFHGSITTNDILVVGENAVIHADIKAGQVEIHGRVFGNMEARKRIEIYPTGRVQGDVRSPTFIIDAGAVFDGRSHMVNEQSEAAASQVEDAVGKGANEVN
jgi:cytoskeletal protein CcmA (bactofilin family)